VSAQETSSDSLHIYRSIEEGLQAPENVRTLEITHLQDTDSLALLSQFPNLTSLSLIDYQFADAPEPIATLTGLKELKFINDDFYTLPESYKDLVNLEHVEFVYDTHLNVESALDFASSLPALKELRIEGLPGFTISDQIVFPNQLRILSLRNNHLNTLPIGIVELQHLEILDIGDNELLELPASISNLSHLNTIYLDQQPFLSFDTTLGLLQKIPELSIVHLEGNHLTRATIDSLRHDALFKIFIDEDHNATSLMYTPHINMNLPPMPKTTYTPENAGFKVGINRN
jgi:Leucine-rich repeat (LRR) protein